MDSEINLTKEYSVYAKVDDDGVVYAVFSTCFQEPSETDVLIKSGVGLEYIHVGYYNVFTCDNQPRYQIVDGVLTELIENEGADMPEEEYVPTVEERLSMLEECMLEMSMLVYA